MSVILKISKFLCLPGTNRISLTVGKRSGGGMLEVGEGVGGQREGDERGKFLIEG